MCAHMCACPCGSVCLHGCIYTCLYICGCVRCVQSMCAHTSECVHGENETGLPTWRGHLLPLPTLSQALTTPPSPGVLVAALTDGEEDSSTTVVPGLPPSPEATWTCFPLLHLFLPSWELRMCPPPQIPVEGTDENLIRD